MRHTRLLTMILESEPPAEEAPAALPEGLRASLVVFFETPPTGAALAEALRRGGTRRPPLPERREVRISSRDLSNFVDMIFFVCLCGGLKQV